MPPEPLDDDDSAALSDAALNAPGLEALLETLRSQRGFDFTGYKRSTLVRRTQRRLQTLGIADYSEYASYLTAHADEYPQLFNTILINVTAFFRDPAAWEVLQRDVVPRLLEGRSSGDPIRAWCAGCATGEEAFSVAIMLAELFGIDRVKRTVKVYATDVDEDALTIARQGTYGPKEVANVPAPLLDKYFERVGNHYTIDTELRRAVIFGRHDIIQDAPISRIDLLVCRNTLMYFTAETQKRILTRLHFALNPDGVLFLGKAEMLLTHGDLFAPIDLKYRIFTPVRRDNFRERLMMISSQPPVTAPSTPERSPAPRLRDASFDAGPVAEIVIDPEGTVAAVNARARSLFNVASRDVGRPLRDLEISYKPLELRSCIEQVARELRPVEKEVEFAPAAGEVISFNVVVSPILQGGVALGTLVSFIDITQNTRLQHDLRASNQELEAAYEEIQSTREEFETTNEELQSTVEELETTNEELQSTNEELETMNEELQSTNEELQTMNDELRRSGDELHQVNAFLGSILKSLRVGVMVLDRELHIQVWNLKSQDRWGLRADEVTGKHVLNLEIGLPVDELKTALRTCLAKPDAHEELLVKGRNRRGKSIECKVSCAPLVEESRVTGVIVTVEDRELPE